MFHDSAPRSPHPSSQDSLVKIAGPNCPNSRTRVRYDLGVRWLLIVLGLAACGRLGFEGVDRDAMGTDGSQAALPGESPELMPGWTADVWADFSNSFTYVPVQYMDVDVEFNNRPHHMFLLASPFEPGIGLVATWEILEVRAPGTVVSHSFYPGTDDGTGPDALFDAELCADWMATSPGICVAAGSQNGGDGIYRIGTDWSISRVSMDNNVCDLVYDPTGAFDGIGAPTLYWSGPTGLRQFGGPVIYAGMLNGAFTEILPSGDVLTLHTDLVDSQRRRLVLLTSGAHEEIVVREAMGTFERVARQHAGVFAAVTGDVGRLPGIGYAIYDTRELMRIEADGTPSVIARAGEGWRWTHALVPPATHPLGQGAPAFYVLELNPTTEVNRIIRLVPP